MSETVITGLFTLAGTFIGGLISFLIARNTKEINTLKSDVIILSKQVISYWNIERLYSEELSKLVSKPARTILHEYREKIESMEFERPTMTEKESKRILTKHT